MTSRPRSKVRLLGLAAGLASVAVLAYGGLVLAGEPEPSVVASSPEQELEEILAPDEPRKVFGLEIRFFEGASPQLVSAELALGFRRALTAAGPSPLHVAIKDAALAVIDEFDAPNPLVLHVDHADGGPGVELQSEAVGDFLFPFSREAKTVEIFDAESGFVSPLISVDLAPAVDAYCAANATDADCVARNDTQPPTVSWVRPTRLHKQAADVPVPIVSLDGSYELEALASDDVGIAAVIFMAGGEEICRDETGAYECLWHAKAGQHVLTAVARDGAGNRTSASIMVVVVAPPEF